MNIALTGSNGFIGSNLMEFLEKNKKMNLIYINRSSENNNLRANYYSFEDFFNNKIKLNIDIIIHLASPNFEYEKEFILRKGITELTKMIIEKLPYYKCKKFIYFSSCKVYGESSSNIESYNEESYLNPMTDYAKAKLEAELLTKELCRKLRINYIIYRLPFVYGAGMKSNLGKIIKHLRGSLPFIIFSDKNKLKRSFLGIKNIELALQKNISDESSFTNEVFNLSDSGPLSLSQLAKLYKIKGNSKSIIIALPLKFFYILARIPLMGKLVLKIFGSFEVDNNKIEKSYNFSLLSTEDLIFKKEDNLN